MSRDLKNALRSTQDMEEYLEVRSSQEIIEDIKNLAGEKTLRDQFAAQALAGILAGGFADTIPHDDVSGGKEAAFFAYQYADAMLAIRSPRPDGGGE